LLARLDVHLSNIPEHLREAFIDPVARERDEFKRASERHSETVKKLESECVQGKIEIADLQNRLTLLYEKEAELQRKVVKRDLKLEQLAPFEAEAKAAKMNAKMLVERESVASQRFESSEKEITRLKEALRQEQENNKKLEEVVRNIPALQSFGESVQRLQTSLHAVGKGGENAA